MTKYYGVDSFPPNCPHSYKSYWLEQAQPVLEAEDRLRSGDLSTRDEVWEAAMTATGSEEVSREILFQWVKSRVEANVPIK